MDKFSKVQKTPVKGPVAPRFQNDYMTITPHQEWDVIQSKDVIVALPYFKDEGYIILRAEKIPSYNLRYQADIQQRHLTRYLTVLTGQVEPGETPTQALRRELYEEAGIVLSSVYPLEITTELFISKGGTAKYLPFLLELNYNSYKQVMPPGDGSKTEEQSTCVRVSIGDLDEIQVHDLITSYMLLWLKKEYDLK